MLDSIVHLLGEKLCQDVKIMRQLPPRHKVHPLNKITIAIGSKGQRTRSGCIGNALTQSLCGKELETEIEAAVYVPLTLDSVLAYEVIDSIAKILIDDGRFGIRDYEHGALSANKTTDSFELHATLTSTLYETEE